MALDLWRDNRVDQHWEIEVDELVDQFLRSRWAHPEMRTDRALAGFIADSEHGLSSVWDRTVLGAEDAFDAALRQIREHRAHADHQVSI